MHNRVEQGTQDARPHDLELAPKFGLGAPLRISNWCQGQKNRPVAQIRPAYQRSRFCCARYSGAARGALAPALDRTLAMDRYPLGGSHFGMTAFFDPFGLPLWSLLG
jgi:hypothetical protein